MCKPPKGVISVRGFVSQFLVTVENRSQRVPLRRNAPLSIVLCLSCSKNCPRDTFSGPHSPERYIAAMKWLTHLHIHGARGQEVGLFRIF